MAISYLYHTFGEDFQKLDLPLLKEIETAKVSVLREMILKNVNSPLTSSLGRLFDGVAAICGIRRRVNFEGQAAMEFEMLAAESTNQIYDYQWEAGKTYRLLPAPIIEGVVADIQNRVPVAQIGAKFHGTLIRLFADF